MRRTLLPLMILAAAAGCGDKPPTSAATTTERPPVSVTVAPVTARTVQRGVSVVGTLAGTEEVAIAPKVDGRVLAVRADVGDVVVPGAVLLELDPTDLRLEADAARRGLEAELARLGLTALPPGEFDVAAVPSVRRAAVTLASADRELARAKSVAGGLTQRELDAADSDQKAADAALRDAVTQARATLASARLKQSALESAEQKLKDATVCAPVPTGQPAWAALLGNAGSPLRYGVSQRVVSEGEMIRSNPVTVVYRLVLDYALKVRAAVPEQYGADVRVGQPAAFRVDAYPGALFPGAVARVNPTVDPATRTFLAEISVPNLDSRLKAGGFARGIVQTRADPGVLTVPSAALVTFAGVTKVFVVEGDKVRAVEVAVGSREKDWLEVRAPGLAAGQKVATSGFSQLVDGSAVAVRQ